MIVTGAYLLVGILYSIPKVSLKDRFVIKTLSIAAGAFLTSLIGSSITSTLNERCIVAAISFAILVFTTSPINDLADYEGDKKNNRKTIPIVLGSRNTILIATIRLLLLVGWFWYSYQTFNFSLLTPIGISAVAVIGLFKIMLISRRPDDYKLIRQKHKSMVFLHYDLQIALIMGML